MTWVFSLPIIVRENHVRRYSLAVETGNSLVGSNQPADGFINVDTALHATAECAKSTKASCLLLLYVAPVLMQTISRGTHSHCMNECENLRRVKTGNLPDKCIQQNWGCSNNVKSENKLGIKLKDFVDIAIKKAGEMIVRFTSNQDCALGLFPKNKNP